MQWLLILFPIQKLFYLTFFSPSFFNICLLTKIREGLIVMFLYQTYSCAALRDSKLNQITLHNNRLHYATLHITILQYATRLYALYHATLPPCIVYSRPWVPAGPSPQGCRIWPRPGGGRAGGHTHKSRQQIEQNFVWPKILTQESTLIKI